MKSLALCLILAFSSITSIKADNWGPFESPVVGFSEAFVPILGNALKSKIVKTLRGFYAVSDDLEHGSRDTKLTNGGIYLDVAVRDSEEAPVLSDSKEVDGTVTRRIVRIPSPGKDLPALVVVFEYGKDVPKSTLEVVDKCIAGVVAAGKRGGR